MIEPTEEMEWAAAVAADERGMGLHRQAARDVVKAVLTLLERDYCLKAKGHVYHPLAKNRGEAD